MVRCEFCHQDVAAWDYPAHQAAHRRLLLDGQQQDYASLPPEARHLGDIAGTPRVYEHVGCGGRTVMQEKIIRSYLRNPFLYDDLNFCTGCGRHVRDRACVWVESGERLDKYMGRLRAEWLSRRWGRAGRLWAWVRGYRGQ